MLETLGALGHPRLCSECKKSVDMAAGIGVFYAAMTHKPFYFYFYFSSPRAARVVL